MSLGTVKSQISRGKKLLRRSTTEQNEGSDHPTIEETYTETPTELIARINRLPETYHKILYLSLVEHLSNRQIATQLGVSLGTVKSQISRGKKLLNSIKQSLKEDNIIDLQIERKRRSPDQVIPSPDQVENQILPEGEISLPYHLASYQYHPENYNEYAVNITDTGDSEAVKIYLQEIRRIPTITHERGD